MLVMLVEKHIWRSWENNDSNDNNNINNHDNNINNNTDKRNLPLKSIAKIKYVITSHNK